MFSLQDTRESRVFKFILCASTDADTMDLRFITRLGIPARDVQCTTGTDGKKLALVNLATKMRRSGIVRQLAKKTALEETKVLVAAGETKEEYEAVLKEHFTAPDPRAAVQTKKEKVKKTKKEKAKKKPAVEEEEDDEDDDEDDDDDDEDDNDEDDDEDDEDDEEESADERALREQIAKLTRKLAQKKKKTKPPPSARVIALREEIATLRQEIEVFLPVLAETHAALAAKYEERTARYETRIAEYDALAAKHAAHVKFLKHHHKLSWAYAEHWNTIQLTLKRIAGLEKRKKTQADELALMTARRDNLQKRRDDAAARKRNRYVVASECCNW
jgi:hypothetical protein